MKTFFTVIGAVSSVLVVVAIAICFYLYIAENSIDRTKPQKIPLGIQVPLNNLLSAIDTNVNRDDYIKLVISVKSATATYGSSLSNDQFKMLEDVTKECDVSIKLWEKAEDDSDYGSVIKLNDSSYDDEMLNKWLTNLNVEEISQEKTSGRHVYYTQTVLKKIMNDIYLNADILLLPSNLGMR